MSYFNPHIYNRNNVRKYCPDGDREAVWGMDYQRSMVRIRGDEFEDREDAPLTERVRNEIVRDAYDEELRLMSCDAMELIVSVLDNLDEDVEVAEIPTEDIIWSFVEEDDEDSRDDALACGLIRDYTGGMKP